MSEEAATGVALRERVERALPDWLQRQRWYSAGAPGGTVLCEELGVLCDDPLVLMGVFTEKRGGKVQRYNVPLAVSRPDGVRPSDPGAIVIEDGDTIVFDALADARSAAPLWRTLAEGRPVELENGRLVGGSDGLDAATSDISPLVREQSNTSLVVGSDHMLKVMRKVVFEPSVELEMGRALADAGFDHLAAIEGWLHYEREGEPHGALVAVVQRFMHNGTDGWTLALTSLRDLYADAEEALTEAATVDRLEVVENQGSSFTFEAARLGEITARMHLAMARTSDAALRPQPITAAAREESVATIIGELERLLDSDNVLLHPLRGHADTLRARVRAMLDVEEAGLALRVHGDYHLGQVLRTDAGWTVLDFEGEPLRPVSERRRVQSPMRDVAGMLRSFDYAAAVALTERGVRPGSDEWAQLAPYGRAWAAANRDAFWSAYLELTYGTEVVPDPGAALTMRLGFEIAKAVYEVGYELAHRPDWVAIPLQFLLEAAP